MYFIGGVGAGQMSKTFLFNSYKLCSLALFRTDQPKLINLFFGKELVRTSRVIGLVR